MTLEEDFPHPLTEFIVYDPNDRRKETIRIAHYEVAREILEQILTRSRRETDKRHERLSPNACKHLAEFSKEFIKYCSNKKIKDSHQGIVCQILTRTFILRENEPEFLTVSEEPAKKRPANSQLLLDIPAGKPMLKERLDILETLSASFPDDPNFHAHVGRFYAFCGPDDEKKAEKRFEKAISLVEKRSKNKNLEDMDDYSKSTLMHVYHMYGVLKKKQISSFTGRSHNDNAKLMHKEAFYEKLEELVQQAEMACDFFRKSREMTPEFCQVFAGAYTDEVNVRLQICDFVTRHFKTDENENSVFKDFLTSKADENSKLFIEDCVCKIESLVTECYNEIEVDSDGQTSLKKALKWFHALFKYQVLPEESLSSHNDIGLRRMQISTLKMDYCGNPQKCGIENVNDAEAVDKILALYEENFDEIKCDGTKDLITKKDLNNDYKEWMIGIRHELCSREYSLQAVHDCVLNWHQLVHSPDSTFYLFALKSIIGIGSDSVEGCTEYLLDAKSLRTDVKKKATFVLRPKFPREWLGAGKEIHSLVPGSRKSGMSFSEAKSENENPDFRICKGTICSPNTKPSFGLIEIDLKVDTLKVFFVPRKAELQGPRFAGRRVQFNLAFTFENGYEGYHVKLLKRHGCTECSAKVEFTSGDTCLPCLTCGKTVEKDCLNEVRTDSETEDSPRTSEPGQSGDRTPHDEHEANILAENEP